jgi:hypothetical protein
MQKKKPSFQVIPNYSINGARDWNESKEVPAEQGCNDIGLRSFLRPLLAFSVRLITIAELSRRQRAQAELHNPRPKMVRRNSAIGAILGPDTAALFIEHSSEI